MLTKLLDPVSCGLCKVNNINVLNKVIKKINYNENVGIYANISGNIEVIE